MLTMLQHLMTQHLALSNQFHSYVTLQNTTVTEAIKKELAARQTDMTAIVRTTDAQIDSAEQSLSQLRIAMDEEQSEQEEEDALTVVSAVEAELATLQGVREIMRDLMSQLHADKVKQAASRTQPGSIHASFGANNSGFQLASNSGSISGLSFESGRS